MMYAEPHNIYKLCICIEAIPAERKIIIAKLFKLARAKRKYCIHGLLAFAAYVNALQQHLLKKMRHMSVLRNEEKQLSV